MKRNNRHRTTKQMENTTEQKTGIEHTSTMPTVRPHTILEGERRERGEMQ